MLWGPVGTRWQVEVLSLVSWSPSCRTRLHHLPSSRQRHPSFEKAPRYHPHRRQSRDRLFSNSIFIVTIWKYLLDEKSRRESRREHRGQPRSDEPYYEIVEICSRHLSRVVARAVCSAFENDDDICGHCEAILVVCVPRAIANTLWSTRTPTILHSFTITVRLSWRLIQRWVAVDIMTHHNPYNVFGYCYDE